MRIVLFWVCLFFLGFSYGQENVIVQTSLSFDTVDVEEVFQLKFSIEGAKVLAQVDMPDLVGLERISGPNTGHVFQVNNGKTSHTYTYSFMIKPLDEGIFILPSILIETDKGSFYTDEKVVVVTILSVAQKEARERRKSKELFSFFSEPMEDQFSNQYLT